MKREMKINRQGNTSVLALFGMFLSFFGVSSALAQTEVAGEVQGIWSFEGSPYVAVEDILIPDNEQLEIQPGVEVRFNANICLYVNGTILAEGNEENNILFTNNADDPQITWRGIRCYESDEGSLISHAIIENAFADSVHRYNKGGGISTDQLSFLTLRNSTIRNCRADMGGGMRLSSPNVSITNCIFENNTGRYGGGLYLDYGVVDGWIHISDNIFRNNHATDSRGAISANANLAFLNITGNRFENNTAESYCGGLYVSNCRRGIIRDNVIIENRAPINAGFMVSGNVLVTGNQFINNEVEAGSAVVSVGSDQVVFYANIICQHAVQSADLIYIPDNCAFESYNDVIFGNVIEGEGSILSLGENCKGKIRNAIIFGNELPNDQPVISSGDYTEVDVRFSDIQGDWDGEGNIDEDPLFANPDELDFQLTENSPCIDAGDPSGVYNDRDESRNDMGIFGGISVFPDKCQFDFGLQAVDIPDVINWKWYNFSGVEAFFQEAFIDNDVFTIEPPDLEIEPFAASIAEVTYIAEGVGEDEGVIELTYIVGDMERFVEIPLTGVGITGQSGEIAGEWTFDDSPYYIVSDRKPISSGI